MSKLFNISVGENEMFGGGSVYESVRDEDILKKISEIKSQEDYNNFYSKIPQKTKDTDTFKNYFGEEINENTPWDTAVNNLKKFLLKKGKKEEQLKKELQRNNEIYDILNVFKSSTPQNPTNPIPINPIPPTIQNATGCIHIGIIDTDGVFVGVHSVANADPLFIPLTTIAQTLKETNKSTPVASIYDKFIEKNDTGCVPTFVDKYVSQFWESKELAEFHSAYYKEKNGTDLKFN